MLARTIGGSAQCKAAFSPDAFMFCCGCSFYCLFLLPCSRELFLCRLPPPFSYFRVIDCKLRYPVPLTPSVACGHHGCRGISGFGPWSDSKRRAKLEKHFKDVHGQVFTTCYPCPECSREFSTAQALNGHLGASSGCTKGTSASKSISRLAGAQMDSSSLSYLKFIFEKVCRSFSGVSPLAGVSGQSVVALYPGRPTRCPWRTLCPSASA